ncbi:MAG: GLPGLI family protein [Saprospiraceae bacterium]|nr:GLPGLI family protein [Saprospiraceae bacterium]
MPFLLSAQMQNEGTVRYLKTHNWAKMISKLDYMSKQTRERILYQWANRSEWKQYCVLHFNQNETKYEDSEEKAEPDDEGGYSWRKDLYFVKRFFEQQKMVEGHEMLGKTYIVEDSLRGFNWKIQNDLKEVAGHICMKAVYEDTVRKHKIEAWFAQDIPISAGPERFYGLPGLILEVVYNEDAIVLTADKIDYKKLTIELDEPKKLKGKRIKESDFTEVIKKHIADKTKAEEPWFWGVRY